MRAAQSIDVGDVSMSPGKVALATPSLFNPEIGFAGAFYSELRFSRVANYSRRWSPGGIRSPALRLSGLRHGESEIRMESGLHIRRSHV